MATSIIEQPNGGTLNNGDAVQPAYTPKGLRYVVESDTADIFMIRADIYINGSTNFKIDHEATLDTLSLGTKEFEFDISTVVQDYLNYTVQSSVITTAVCDVSVEVYIDFYEITNTGGVITVAGAASDSSNDIYAVNVARQFEDDKTSSFNSKYVLSDDTGASGFFFLTDAPQVKQIGNDEQEVIGICMNRQVDAGDLYKLAIGQYDAAYNLLTSTQLDISAAANVKRDIGIGTRNLNDAWGVTIQDDCKYYTIMPYFYDNSKSQFFIGEIRLYHIVERVCDDSTRFHFLNAYGRIDSVTLEAGEVIGQNVSSKTYQTYLPTDYTIGSGNNRGHEEGRIVANRVRTAYMDLKSKADVLWLMQLYYSPQVWIEEPDELGNATMIPVIVMNKEDIEWTTGEREMPKIRYYIAHDLEVQRN